LEVSLRPLPEASLTLLGSILELSGKHFEEAFWKLRGSILMKQLGYFFEVSM
jgi:hypothetical protein